MAATTTTGAGASTQRSCSHAHRLAKRSLIGKVAGKRVRFGTLYVYAEGSRFCAYTTSAGTAYSGVAKYMKVELGTGDADRFDDGQYADHTAPVRLAGHHHGFVAMGIIRLSTGEQAGAVASSHGRS